MRHRTRRCRTAQIEAEYRRFRLSGAGQDGGGLWFLVCLVAGLLFLVGLVLAIQRANEEPPAGSWPATTADKSMVPGG